VQALYIKMSQRIDFYARCMYGFSSYMGYIPFKYRLLPAHPDLVVPADNPKTFTRYARISSVIVSALVVYWYYEAAFGKPTKFELLFLLGCNCIFCMILASQVFFLRTSTRLRGITVMNAVLDISHWIKAAPSQAYEITSLLLTVCNIFYPFIYFPWITLVAAYLPGTFRGVNLGIDLAIAHIGVTNPETAALTNISLCCVIYAILSVGLAQGVTNLTILLKWLYTIQYTIFKFLEYMRQSKKFSILLK